MFPNVTLGCPLAWRASHWRAVLSLTSDATFLRIRLALTLHSTWIMCLFFFSFPSFPAVVYFYMWSDIEARGSARLRFSAPDLSLAQLLLFFGPFRYVTFFLKLSSERTQCLPCLLPLSSFILFTPRGVIPPSWNTSCWSLREMPPSFFAWFLLPKDNISDRTLLQDKDLIVYW